MWMVPEWNEEQTAWVSLEGPSGSPRGGSAQQGPWPAGDDTTPWTGWNGQMVKVRDPVDHPVTRAQGRCRSSGWSQPGGASSRLTGRTTG